VDEPAEPAVFIPAAQADHSTSMLFENWFARHLLVRTQGDTLALNRAIAGILADTDPGVALGRIRPMDEVFARAVSLPRFLLLLLGILGGVALLLASTGLYGVISHSVASRTREIGVRLAIGADPDRIGRLVLRDGLGLVLSGIALGAGASLLLTGMFSHLVHGVEPAEPRLLLLTALVLLGVGVAASWLPARRASRVDPMVALRTE
jgi:putative ABC transport system permease protein